VDAGAGGVSDVMSDVDRDWAVLGGSNDGFISQTEAEALADILHRGHRSWSFAPLPPHDPAL
jgi:hypothetical protein